MLRIVEFVSSLCKKRGLILQSNTSAHSIRDDIAKAIYKIRPRLKRNSNTKRKDTIFTGYSRFALPVDEFSIVSVDAAHLGETKPSKVMGEIAMDLKVFKDEIYSEWIDLRVNVVRLVGVFDVDSEDYINKRWDEFSMKELGIAYVRGCHIVFIRDGDSPQHVMNEYDLETGEKYTTNSTKRIYDVAFDCAQYQLDIESMVENVINESRACIGLAIHRYVVLNGDDDNTNNQ
eukprot:863100_1